jgi:hypothetical protein
MKSDKVHFLVANFIFGHSYSTHSTWIHRDSHWVLGLTLEHAVDSFKGERVCYAYFMRDRVHEWAQVPGKDWMETDYYR